MTPKRDYLTKDDSGGVGRFRPPKVLTKFTGPDITNFVPATTAIASKK